MGLASRRKGQRGERALATLLRVAFPGFAASIKRGWQARVGCDDPDVVGLPGFWLESKCGKLPNPRAALAQATLDAKGRAIPMAVIRDDRKPPFVVLHLSDMLTVLSAAYGFSPPLGQDYSHDAPKGDPRQLTLDEAP